MKFIDEAVIQVIAGNGGRGCVSFRREKYIPRGGPDGGNGGKGGDVILKTSPGMSTLMDLKYKKHFRSTNGKMGRGKCQDGCQGEYVLILVPLGTLVYDEASGECLCDMTEKDQEFIVAHGGKGGRGNTCFKSSTRQAPRMCEDGEEGEKKTIRLELKLLADIGLIGMPNAGKSTFLTKVSKARPKVADYPFTTLVPSLGVVTHRSYAPFTIADIPGLIEGAHKGAGLGIQFLKHIERTKIFLHLVSLSPDEIMSPLNRFQKIQNELLEYSSLFTDKSPVKSTNLTCQHNKSVGLAPAASRGTALAYARNGSQSGCRPNDGLISKDRVQIVVLTKSDLVVSSPKINKITSPFKRQGYLVFPISSVTGKGIGELLDTLGSLMEKKC